MTNGEYNERKEEEEEEHKNREKYALTCDYLIIFEFFCLFITAFLK